LKKLLIIFILITNGFSSDKNYELQLYEKVLPSIFQKSLLVYTDDKNIIKNSKVLKLTSECKKADLLLGDKFDNLPVKCHNKPIFSTSRRGFKNNKNAIGAFYWRKGRPQIKFKLDALKKYNLVLPNALQEFAQ